MLRKLATFGVCALTVGLLTTPAPVRAAEEGPPTVNAGDIDFTPDQELEYGSAEQAGLVPRYVEQLTADTKRFLQPSPDHPLYAGAVVLAARNGVIATHEAAGHALRYKAYKDGQPVPLPRERWIPASRDTIFDLASLTKVFTAVAVMQQVEEGRIELDAPVASYIPAFAQNGKGGITVRQLLTHTSGLQPTLSLYEMPGSRADRIAAVYAVKPQAPPGTEYIYSDLNYITLGELVATVAGAPLDEVLASTVTEPLGMDDTMFTPPASLRERIAATEYEPWVNRGMVWGKVHDENAWALGGVAGHAGLFSTAGDLAIFAQMLLNGGTYGGTRVLQPETVRAVLTNYNGEYPGDEHGLGFSLGQHWFMDAMTTPVTFGHTGYTGTSLVVDPLSHSFAILLSNNVHPTREWPSSNPARRAVARDVGRAVPVEPAEGDTAWFSRIGNRRTATLTLPLAVPSGGARMKFDLWYSTEGTDPGALEVSRNGGKTWQPVPLRLRVDDHEWSSDGTFAGMSGRQWIKAEAALPADTTHIRWRYTTDPLYQGRGVYVDGVRVWKAHGGLIFNGSRPSDAAKFQPHGWTRSEN